MRIVFATLLALTAWSAEAQKHPQAPTGRCRFQFDNLPESRLNSIQLPSKQYNTYIGGGVIARCPAQKLVLRADSLEAYGDEGRFFFIGHVNYSEPRLKLTSDFLTYFQRDERLLGFGNVDAKLPSGSTLKGSQIEMFKAIPKVRTQHGVALGRPTITLIDRDARGKPQPPVFVTGNTIWMESDSVVSSQGEVTVVRPELTATADSLYLDGGKGLLRLMRNPKVRGTRGRPFTLAGETIDLLTRRRKLDRVLSKTAAEAVSEDLTLKADSIDMRVSDDLLQRATAWGKNRARAMSPSQAITSDSIDVIMPGQRVREIHAIRKAVAEGMPDTSKFRTTENDRLTGDTIVAYFDSIPPRDTVTKPRISRLLAMAGPTLKAEDYATALSHFPPRDTSLRKPAINYVRGQRVTVTFDSGAVKKVLVTPQESGGAYFEPEPDRPAAPAPAPPGSAPGRPATVPATVPATAPANPPANPPRRP